jgi:hypothetical protein
VIDPEVKEISQTLVGLNNQVQENINSSYDTTLLENGKELDNGNDDQLGNVNISDESFVILEELNNILANVMQRFGSVNSK